MIQRLYNVMGRITDGSSSGLFNGAVEQWVEELTTVTIEHGMDSYIFAPDGSPSSQLQRFATEIIPRVRENIARHASVSLGLFKAPTEGVE